jgi:transposase-like protein
MIGKRRIHTAAFKAKVAVEAIKGEQTLNEIGKTCEVHPVQVAQWRKVLLEGAATLFERGVKVGDKALQAREDELLREVGRLQVEVSFLKKKLAKFP